MDSKVKVSIIVVILTILMILVGSPWVSPEVVKAADSFVPYKDTGSISISVNIDPPSAANFGYDGSFSCFGSPYGVYHINTNYPFPDSNPDYASKDLSVLIFNIDSPVIVSSYNFLFANSSSYFYNFNGVNHTVYYSCIYCSYTEGFTAPINGVTVKVEYDENISGVNCFENFIYNSSQYQKICNYFLFGVGDLDYELPAQDIPDSDLDIKGLSCTVLNDQQASVQVAETMKNIWDREVATWYSFIFDSPKEYISKGIDNSGVQFIQNYVPGVSLIWDSPPVNQVADQVNPDATIINYDVWIDGRSEIKYLSAVDAIKNFFSGTSVGSCAYSKLKIHEGPMVTNPYYTYYYNTNQGLETILDYISDNTTFTRPTEIDQYQNISCQTTISRIYIQASKIDPETGDRLYGAVSYVDLSNNIPTVYEGETIEDIPPSDPNDGATTDTAQPFTVSGDNIVYNYPVTNNEGGIGYNGGGLIVPTSGLLSAGLALIQAIMELIRSWFLLHLVPFITLGFTGHF